MDATYWHKQSETPLFAEIEWNKPERRDQAGRLLIIGGGLHHLNAPAHSYECVKQTGIGSVKVALPDKTKRLVGATLPDAVFLPSTASGELSHEGATELLGYASWADTLLFPGDTGRNSQTTILFEELLRSYTGQAIITRDALDSIAAYVPALCDRPQTTLVTSFAQLQKLLKHVGSNTALVFSMDLMQVVAILHSFTQTHQVAIATMHQDQLIVACGGKVSTTKLQKTVEQSEPPHWRLSYASIAACYQTWNPTKLFEALTYSAYSCVQHLTNS